MDRGTGLRALGILTLILCIAILGSLVSGSNAIFMNTGSDSGGFVSSSDSRSAFLDSGSSSGYGKSIFLSGGSGSRYGGSIFLSSGSSSRYGRSAFLGSGSGSRYGRSIFLSSGSSSRYGRSIFNFTIPTTIPTTQPTTVPTTVPTTQPQITAAPAHPVKLIFVHHSSGENWLSDDNGGLGIALMNNNYFVSDTNYGWGPEIEGLGPIGDYTDIGNWWLWFRSPQSGEVISALYYESGQNAAYSRLAENPGTKNQIIMIKSCFPNSNLLGSAGDPVSSIGSNPLRGQDSSSEYHTIANAKGIYIDLLEFFRAHQDTLFVVVTAPPVSDSTHAANARAFNNWLVNEWLRDYPYQNVMVFDFYNVLTSNSGSNSVNDATSAGGNHHRFWNGQIQHVIGVNRDTSAYALSLSDDHPSAAGNRKATIEFVPLLNIAYNRWHGG